MLTPFKVASCGEQTPLLAVIGALDPGWINKQEKAGWVAIAPARQSQQPETPAARAYLRGFQRFYTDGIPLDIGWVAICLFQNG